MKKIVAVFLFVFVLGVSPVRGQDIDANTWPREFDSSLGKLTVYTPQVESWKDKVDLKAWMAVMLQPKEDPKKEIPGAVLVGAKTTCSPDNQTVRLNDFTVEAVRFPDMDETTTTQYKAALAADLTTRSMTVEASRILAQLSSSSDITTGSMNDISTSAPKIFTSNEPAILVQFDGTPVLSPLGDTGLLYVVNTNWDVIVDTTSTKVYLLNKDQWLYSTEIENPNWQFLRDPLPDSFNKIPADDESWSDVRAQIPAKPVEPTAKLPKVFISYSPAELIQFDGVPRMRSISGTKLMSIENTESDLFFNMPDQTYFYLVSGRWYSAKSMDGPWDYATTTLPEDFAKIPKTDKMARVLASVPGTPEANNAVQMATMPKVAIVKRDDPTTLVVSYTNDKPVFKDIEKLDNISYAVNTPNIVFHIGPNYYCCYSGCWYVSASANGPWTLCDNVPTVVYDIPATVPVYPARYVRVYDHTPNVIVFGYVDGYTNSYICNGTVVYGTGYYYRPFVADVVHLGLGILSAYIVHDIFDYHHHDFFVRDWRWFYHPPRPWNWYSCCSWYVPTCGFAFGFSACYNPWNGGWIHRSCGYGPYGGLIGLPRFVPPPPPPPHGPPPFNPWHGPYLRGFEGHGPNRDGFGAPIFNPRTNPNGFRGGDGPYNHWRDDFVRRGNDWARKQPGGPETRIGRDGNRFINDGRGNRYVEGRDGKWNKFDGTRWSRNVQPPQNLIDSNKGQSPSQGPQARRGGERRNNDNMFVGRDGNIYRQDGKNDWKKYDNDGRWNKVDPAKVRAGRLANNDRPTNQPDRNVRFGPSLPGAGRTDGKARDGSLNHDTKRPGDNLGDLNNVRDGARRPATRPSSDNKQRPDARQPGQGQRPVSNNDNKQQIAEPKPIDPIKPGRNPELNHDRKRPGDNLNKDLNRARNDQPGRSSQVDDGNRQQGRQQPSSSVTPNRDNSRSDNRNVRPPSTRQPSVNDSPNRQPRNDRPQSPPRIDNSRNSPPTRATNDGSSLRKSPPNRSTSTPPVVSPPRTGTPSSSSSNREVFSNLTRQSSSRSAATSIDRRTQQYERQAMTPRTNTVRQSVSPPARLPASSSSSFNEGGMNRGSSSMRSMPSAPTMPSAPKMPSAPQMR